MQTNIIKNSNKIYNEAVKKYGNNSSAVLWNDQQTQYLRFNEILNFINLDDNISILDIGCGNAELYRFLNFNGFRGSYTGFDINDNLLSQAKQNYTNIDVQNIDILTTSNIKQYDYVVLSGLFNCNYGQDINWVFKMIEKMYEISKKKIIFNAITSYVNYKDDCMIYLDPKEILDYSIKNISSEISLIHGKLPYNYTVCISKQKSWTSISNA
jgi:SAM-dependent methyltransferase